jgi:large subunit ribosomal protein L6
MSKIGRKPIQLPNSVKVDINDDNILVKGPKGQLSRKVPSQIKVESKDGNILVKRLNDSKFAKALHGLTRSLINNMVIGVSEGFEKNLEIVGVGYKAQLQGKKLSIQIGFNHPVVYEPPEGITIQVPEPTKIKVLGIDKELVGQVAADIRAIRPPEPYKGKGIRYENEQVLRKAGKARI